MSKNYQDYMADLVKLISFEKEGNSESEEAYILREKMIEPWHNLTEHEKKMADEFAENSKIT